MHVAGIDAHTTYVVVSIVSNDGALSHTPVRISNGEPDRLVGVLEPYLLRTIPGIGPYRGLLIATETYPSSASKRPSTS